jgi:SAM-dependent methyltransferase
MSRQTQSTDYSSPEYAARFEVSRSLTPVAVTVWSELMKNAASGSVQTVIDLGAGTGRFWPSLQRAFPAAEIIAIDRNATMLRHRETSSKRVWKLVADAVRPPLKGQIADFALCSMLLHHVNEPNKMLARLGATLKAGSRIFIRQGTQETLESFVFLKYFPTALEIELERMPATDEVLAMIEGAGLKIIETQKVVTSSAESIEDYIAKITSRGFPSLQLVSDEEFLRGIELLRCQAEKDSNTSQILEGEATAIFVCEVPYA